MIIQLEKDLNVKRKQALIDKLAACGYSSNAVTTQKGDYLIALGKTEIDIREIGHMAGIADIHVVSDNYKLVSRKWKVRPTVIDLGDQVDIGGEDLALMAGPCSIEDEQQVEQIIDHLVQHGVRMMRGGVFKPRSSPYAFRGLGMEGLKMWSRHAAGAGIKIVTEVMQVSQIEEMLPYTDLFQVGARNTQNFNLLDALGKIDKPVMIKRGISGTIDELLYSAEYVFSGGNEKLVLCERGIRTYERASRNTLDLNAIPILKEKTHLPVVADPSHGIGIRRHVEAMALACVMAGADGVMFEIHPSPEEAFSDADQTVDFRQSASIIRKLREAHRLRQSMGTLW